MIYKVTTTKQADTDLRELFRLYEKEPCHSRGLRVMPVDKYLVFYIPDKKVRLVTVIRVMYSGRDIDTQLRDYTIM